MNASTANPQLPIRDRIRIALTGLRYSFWLDLYCVPGATRRMLRRELKANLSDAARRVGIGSAHSSIGSIRRLAAETTRDGLHRSRWTAGWVSALMSLTALLAMFAFLTLYWVEGALDANAAEPIRSSLFPFFGSTVELDPGSDGFTWTMMPGPMPFLSAAAIWLLVAKPWRALNGHTS